MVLGVLDNMKYILMDYTFVVMCEDDELDYTLRLIRKNKPGVCLIVEDTADACMKYAPVRWSSIA